MSKFGEKVKEEEIKELVQQVSPRHNIESRVENVIETDQVSEQVSAQVSEQVTSVSIECIEFIKHYEGFRDTAYKLAGEKYHTIGYGHNGSDVKSGQTITQESAERLLIADLEGYTNLVLKECEYLNLNQGELNALVSFTYNCGIGSLKKLTANGTRTKEEIADHITAYTKSNSEANRKGLLARREAEKEMFLGGV